MFLSFVLCTTVLQNDSHTPVSTEQFFKLSVGLSLGLAFCVFFCFSIDNFLPVLFAIVVLGLVSSVYQTSRLAGKNVFEMT